MKYILLILALLLIPALASAAAPVSSFSVDYTGGISPLLVNFTDSSTNTPTIWKWYADKLGGTSTLFNSTQSPMYAAFTTGNYSIKLNASNAAVGTNSSQVTWINVTAASAPVIPIASFTIIKVNTTTATLLDTSGNCILGRDWYFGDGTTNSTDTSPTHTFPGATSGYTVGLVVTNASGYNSTQRAANPDIIVPVASITKSTPQLVLPTASLIVNGSGTNTPTSYIWSYGDGTTGTSRNATHAYSTGGTYTLGFWACNLAGCGYATDSVTVIYPPAGSGNTSAPTPWDKYKNDPATFFASVFGMISLLVSIIIIGAIFTALLMRGEPGFVSIMIYLAISITIGIVVIVALFYFALIIGGAIAGG